ncbi:MAG: DUF4337 domain-containing protein [Deltaproteobacteria bacterium]|nr:DUF4337 domain-containing protein [Deltaproteobacteria bacterium]
MPVEIEVPTEHLHETIHEEHHKSGGHGHGEAHGHGGGGFTLGVALSSAILAVVAALAALFAGHYANDAMIERIEAGDKWSYYQAKSIKESVLRTKVATIEAMGKPVDPKDEKKIEKYEDEQGEIQAEANKLTDESEAHLTQHTRLAGSVTFFQVAIALGAIAVLTKRKELWFASLLVGLLGAGTMAYGFMPPPEKEHEATHRKGGEKAGEKNEANAAHGEGKVEHAAGEAKAGEAKPAEAAAEKPAEAKSAEGVPAAH